MAYQPGDSELGRRAEYDSEYNPDRLFAIARAEKRQEIGVDDANLPFNGVDIWNHYEVSWLNAKGKPVVAVATLQYDCSSHFIIESKSLKLYFNSFNNSNYENIETLESVIAKDLSKSLQADVEVSLRPLNKAQDLSQITVWRGECIDSLDVDCNHYLVAPELLAASGDVVEECLTSHLLKSNCLVTGQPDWGSVMISYRGPSINRASLLRYIVSFRNHNEFHEQCIERIFNDIWLRCKPESLTVYGRYTRRGGIDINPYRTSEALPNEALNLRLVRQ